MCLKLYIKGYIYDTIVLISLSRCLVFTQERDIQVYAAEESCVWNYIILLLSSEMILLYT
jgi:hypothetical protein